MLISNSVDYAFSRKLAIQFGIPAAMVMNRIIWSINIHAENSAKYSQEFYEDDNWWMADSMEALQLHFNGIFSLITIKRAIKDLEAAGMLISKKRFLKTRKWNHTKSYAINIAMLKSLDSINLTPSENSENHSVKMRQTESNNLILSHSIKSELSSSLNSQLNSQTNSPTSPSAAGVSLSLVIDKKPKPPKYEPQDLKIGQLWLEFALEQMPWQKSWTAEKFAVDLAKVRKATGINHEGLEHVLEFIKGDKFWQEAAISPANLLKKQRGSDIRKIDYILNRATKNERKSAKVAKMVNSSEDPF